MNSVRIDLGLSRYSDMAFTSAVVVLVVALLVLAVELARVRVRRVHPRTPAATVVAGDGRPGLVVEAPCGRGTNASAGRVWRWSTSARHCC